jgi:ring-1,2-phenylacetyl-CoA epoxidase subunit PaaD
MTTHDSESGDLKRIWQALQSVKDPEMPVVSVVEMGIIAGVDLTDDAVTVRMTPTFVGCPAVHMMREQIRRSVEAAGFAKVRVDLVFDPPWTSARISPEGLRKLQDFGLALPTGDSASGAGDEPVLDQVPCPYCGSHDTRLESLFGPTICRAIHYCDACHQSFEQFKPVD